MEDAGGPCGWYPVVEDATMQNHIRKIGKNLIPQYQYDLNFGDPGKITFRFYVVVEKEIRSDLTCHPGLVLIPLEVVERMQNDDQLAAVLADGIAENIQLVRSRDLIEQGLISAAEMALFNSIPVVGSTIGLGSGIMEHDLLRRHEEARGRIALGLMADAGFDPYQAPESWRLLAPGELPSKLDKLKYPVRSRYLEEILSLEYKNSASVSTSEATHPPTK